MGGEAVEYLGHRSHAHLLNAMVDCGFPLPRKGDPCRDAVEWVKRAFTTEDAMIAIVMPDSGPLISLARANRLDLLERFKASLLITDAVYIEMAGGESRTIDERRLIQWIRLTHNQVRVVDTTFGSLLREVKELRATLPESERAKIKRTPLTKNAGENAIREMADRMRPILNEDHQALVIFEDSRVKTMDFGAHVRMLSTWSFAVALERAGVIESAHGLFDQIEANGRIVARETFDSISTPISHEFSDFYDTETIERKDVAHTKPSRFPGRDG